MITGSTLLQQGWPEGPLIGGALAVARALSGRGLDDETIAAALHRILDDPAAVAAGEPGFDLAQALLESRRQPVRPEVRDTPLDAPIWGRDLIDPAAIDQLRDAMRLPVTVAGALMPDAHVGYGIPIGGVVALDNAVAPYMVGVDIACRMMMSVYPAEDGAYLDDPARRDTLREALHGETRFGIGANFKPGERRRHAVLDDPDWDATPLLRGLKDKAHAQLGTSGTGNHFVDVGRLTLDDAGAAALNLPGAGGYFAVLSHSGSRGVGATIADRYSKLAREATPLPDKLRHLAWLGLDSDLGREYWLSMNLAGRFASACHHTLHEALAAALGIERLSHVENHHNFAWKEEHDGRPVIVHRKGATPAHDGTLGIIPGSQGHPSYIVRGRGEPSSLNSASHGAGRQMSRTAAIKAIPPQDRDAWLRERGIELLAGGMDEAPQAYKDIDEVLALQRDLAEPIASFRPEVVLMAGDGKSEG